MNYRFLTVIVMCISLSLNAQRWSLTSADNIASKGIKDIIPDKFTLYDVDDADMKTILWSAPSENEQDLKNTPTTINVGLPDGNTESFRILRYDMMEPELAMQYPDIRTFYGISVSDAFKRIRIDYSHQGFRAVISSPLQGKIFIDHYQRNDRNTRIVYYKNDYRNAPAWECNIGEEHLNHARISQGGQRIGDCQLRSYRLAQATTGEYSNYHGATSSAQSALVMAAVVNVINRINEVYEAEVAVRLILVANTSSIFYYTPTTDPYTNNDGGTMLGENITTCNSVIGSGNYDIGHVFSTGGGGVAYLHSVCTSNKAGGVTGSAAPVGDPFTIDYVAHEMGHQFNGNHTQYNSCNRAPMAAREPGSASTIMGYAGICSPNVQNNSDAYFHAYSIEEIKTYVNAGSSCEQIISSYVNSPPNVTAQPNYSIPVSTPFALTLSATDPEGHPITYAWEQMDFYTDPAQTMPPTSSNITGPVFRSVSATTSNTRYFPPLANVLANTTNTWQVLPSVARSMSFRGVARDFTGVAGCNNEINITVSTVNAASGAFSVTAFNTASSWMETETKTITWNVAGTTAAPISAATVDILLSYDGGTTFPVTLAAATANDGTQNIIVPAGTTTQGRILIRGTNHIFFDINNANITITANPATFSLSANPASFSICQGQTVNSTITVTSSNGYSTPVTLSASGLPSGVTATFTPNPVTPGSTSQMALTAFNTNGNYNITVTGVSGTITKTTSITVGVTNSNTPPVLSTPANNATGVSTNPVLTWVAGTGVISYDIQIAYDNAFSDLQSTATSVTNSYTVTNTLYGFTSFYWRVRQITNCGTSAWSTVLSFTTEPCWTHLSSNVPLSIAGSNPVVYSNLVIGDRGTVNDLNVVDLNGTHSGVAYLAFTVFNVENNTSLFWDHPCTKFDMNFNINFDDEASGMNWPCPPVDDLVYKPSNVLSAAENGQVKGLWKLKVQDDTGSPAGSLLTWGIKTCAADYCRLTVDHTRATGAGSLKAAIDCALAGDTIKISPALSNDTILLGTQNLVVNKQLYIQGDITKNIHIMSTSTNPTVVCNAPATGHGFKLKGLHIHSSNSGVGAIQNTGKLTLEDVILHKWTGTSTATVLNDTGGNTTLIGNCKVVNN